MTDYGVLPTGFSRKPLSVIIAEIEASLITEFGPGLVQTAQSPMGQINGIFADRTSAVLELIEDIYHALDPDQAEGVNLDIIGRIRRIPRAAGQSDASYRQAITNAGQARIDLQDISRAIAALDGVTYSKVWTRDDTDSIPSPANLSIAVTGGDADEIAATIRAYVVPGMTLYGNTTVESTIDGYCRSFRILRPIDVPVTLEITIRTFRDALGCPPPSATAVKAALINEAYFLNGDDITFYAIRQIIESAFSNVEVLTINGERDSIAQSDNQPVSIGFIERASLASDDVTVTVV
ncbi:MAG: hypothetical protein ACK4SQ_14210 [Allorhizobium sp.]